MTWTRREVLKAVALGVLAPTACVRPWRRPQPAAAPAPGVVLNDVHSQLNPTRVERVVAVDSLAGLRRAVGEAAREGKALSVAGGRHAMGGQQFGEGTIHLDTRPLRRVLAIDLDRGVMEVEAGIQWPELVDFYLRAQAGRSPQWGIAQKQTGADRLSLGGALAANAHGRGLTLKPIVGQVESFILVDARGDPHECSRAENPQLFRLAMGGYGLFGILYSIRLRLVPRQKVERVVEIRSAGELARAVEERIAAGFLYGDFQFSVDPASEGFLQEGAFSCYRPVDPATPIPQGQKELADEEWAELIYLAHADEAEAFRRYTRYYLATSGQIYWTDTQQLGFYADDYHAALDRRLGARAPGSEMITELYVPRREIGDFLEEAAAWLREAGSEVVYGTVRWIERDDETFLPWAKERYACTVFNLHVEHTPEGIERAKREFRGLIDLALARGGSFFLTYHRWATREQILACYPQMPEFLQWKRHYDPEERFQSDWYRHHREMLQDLL